MRSTSDCCNFLSSKNLIYNQPLRIASFQIMASAIFQNSQIQIWLTIFASCLLLFFLQKTKKERRVKRLARKNKTKKISSFLRSGYDSNNDYPGIYILKNKKNGKCYVGQGRLVNRRARQHFYGHGNPNVYVDYTKGHKFTITIVPLKHSGMKDLNELERIVIKAFNGYSKGYNRNRGNNPRRKAILFRL